MSCKIEDTDQNFENKKRLKEILEEEDMVRWLKKLLGLEISTSDNQIEELKEKIKSSEAEKKELKEEIGRLKNKLSSSEKQVEELKEKQIEDIQRLKREVEKYELINKKYSIYMDLSEETKKDLVRIFRVDGLESFIACGSQYDNISSLFEYIKINIQNENFKDVEKVKKLFNYFFHLYNKTSEIESYSFLETKEGRSYDTETEVRTGDSKMSGEIQKILLIGYKNNSTNKIIKKSVVKL